MSLFANRTKIWKQGQTTNPFVVPQVSFSKSKRFKLYSIYWPEKLEQADFSKESRSPIDQEAYKISKIIDEEQKNQSRMNKKQFNSTRKQGLFIEKSQPRNGFSTFRPSRTESLSKQNQQIISRLTQSSLQKRQSKLRDRHGNRTNLLQNQQQQFQLQKFKQQRNFSGTQTGFYTSRRIKLDLPHNYYPGPGTYELKRYLQQTKRPSSIKKINQV